MVTMPDCRRGDNSIQDCSCIPTLHVTAPSDKHLRWGKHNKERIIGARILVRIISPSCADSSVRGAGNSHGHRGLSARHGAVHVLGALVRVDAGRGGGGRGGGGWRGRRASLVALRRRRGGGGSSRGCGALLVAGVGRRRRERHREEVDALGLAQVEAGGAVRERPRVRHEEVLRVLLLHVLELELRRFLRTQPAHKYKYTSHTNRKYNAITIHFTV